VNARGVGRTRGERSSLLVEAISVIIRVDRLLDVWQNDWDAFVRSVRNQTLCADTEIARVGFITSRDVKDYLHKLETRGLIYGDELGTARDMVVVDQQHGPCMRCEWIEWVTFTSATTKPNELPLAA
jgi:hypothetical protein